jgi:acylphosphatase
MSEKLLRLHAVIAGRVQQVGFRNFVEEAADNLHLSGWVRNLYSGEVEVVAEGSELQLQQLSALLKTGPQLAYIRDYQEDYSPATGEYRSFQVRSTYIGD